MNTPLLAVLSLFTFLFSSPSVHAQEKPLTAAGFATKASVHIDFETNEAYRVENTGMDGRSFARNRTTGAKLRLKEGIRNAETTLDHASKLGIAAQEKVTKAKYNLEQAKRQGSLSAKTIYEMESDVSSAEEKLKRLQKSIAALNNLLLSGETL